jgi:phosphoglycolate phosphatase-like HAD superfamily hydrolase
MREIEAPRWLRLDEPFADATTTLRAMRAAGATPLIVTARRDAAAVRNQVERLAPELLLAVVRPGITAAREKARALSGRGAAVLIGDTESDADAARTAGIPFVAVSRGQRSEAFLIARGLTPVYGDLAAAWEAVQSMTSSV